MVFALTLPSEYGSVHFSVCFASLASLTDAIFQLCRPDSHSHNNRRSLAGYYGRPVPQGCESSLYDRLLKICPTFPIRVDSTLSSRPKCIRSRGGSQRGQSQVFVQLRPTSRMFRTFTPDCSIRIADITQHANFQEHQATALATILISGLRYPVSPETLHATIISFGSNVYLGGQRWPGAWLVCWESALCLGLREQRQNQWKREKDWEHILGV